MRQRQKGFTLIEVVVALGIVGAVVVAVGMTITTLLLNYQRPGTQQTLLQQVQNAGYQMMRDIQMSSNVMTGTTAFPYIVTQSTGRTSTTDTTSHSITMPTGITAGNLLICIFSVDGAPTFTASSGWTQLGQARYSTVVTQAIFYKVAVGGDTLTITTSVAEQSSHIVLRIAGAGSTITGTPANGSSTNSNPPSHNAGSSQKYLWVATRGGDSTIVPTAIPTNYSSWTQYAAAGTGGASTSTATRQYEITTEDPGTWTVATEEWVCWTLAIPPATAFYGFPVTINIPVDQDQNNDYHVDYLLDGDKLKRKQFDSLDNLTAETVIAQYVDTGSTVFESPAESLYKLTIRVSLGEEAVTASYEARRRLTIQ